MNLVRILIKIPFFGFIEGKGQQLMDWVIQELKPMIDEKISNLSIS